jgi:hypothetical protein
MFHLLVSYQGWPDGAGTIPSGRIYVRADNELEKSFLKDGKLDITQVGKIPALLVTETGGNGPQFARLAHITGVVQGPRDTAIQYAVDSSIRPIANIDLERFSAQLGITKNALTHTHWAIQNADLFKVLLMNQQRNAITTKVFSIDSIYEQDTDLVSVMMPFTAKFDAVYSALQEAASSAGLKCMRADDFWEHHAVIQDIVNLIARARVVICDCSGRNPNVFYEVGIAHSLGKEVILITQSENDVPFDLRHLRYVHYLNNGEGLIKLSAAVQSRIRTILGGRTG